jgi:hypothetical protein
MALIKASPADGSFAAAVICASLKAALIAKILPTVDTERHRDSLL